jgi:phage terminase large subunit-like protein
VRHGIEVIDVPQVIRRLTFASKEWEAMVASGQWYHDGNPVMTWCVSNVIWNEDGKGNYMPKKASPKARIDGVAATITALGLVLSEEEHGESVYETQELLVL